MSIDIEAVDFATLLPPLTPGQYDELRDSIGAHGVLDPLIYWQETGELIDGYHRSAVTTDLGITDFPRAVMSFPSKTRAVIFVINKHLGRRQISLQSAVQLRDVVRELARRLVIEEGLTQRQAAQTLGVGYGTVNRAVNPVIHVDHSDSRQESEPLRAPGEMRVGDLPEMPPAPVEPPEATARYQLLRVALRFAAVEPAFVLSGWDEADPRDIARDAARLRVFGDWVEDVAIGLEKQAEMPRLRRVPG